MNFFKKTKKGFTLVELVVVIAVIAILAAVSVGAYFGVTESANNSRSEQEAKQAYTQLQTKTLAGLELGNSGISVTLSNTGLKFSGLYDKNVLNQVSTSVFDQGNVIEVTPMDDVTNIPEEADENAQVYFFATSNSSDSALAKYMGYVPAGLSSNYIKYINLANGEFIKAEEFEGTFVTSNLPSSIVTDTITVDIWNGENTSYRTNYDTYEPIRRSIGTNRNATYFGVGAMTNGTIHFKQSAKIDNVQYSTGVYLGESAGSIKYIGVEWANEPGNTPDKAIQIKGLPGVPYTSAILTDVNALKDIEIPLGTLGVGETILPINESIYYIRIASAKNAVYLKNITFYYDIDSTIPEKSVTGISLSDSQLKLGLGNTYTLTATIEPSEYASSGVIWTSSDPTKVSVDSNGLISGLAVTEKPVTITATSAINEFIKKECKVTVIDEVTYNAYLVNGLEQIKDGDKVIIANKNSKRVVNNISNKAATTIDMEDDISDNIYTFTNTNDVMIFELKKLAPGTYTFNDDTITVEENCYSFIIDGTNGERCLATNNADLTYGYYYDTDGNMRVKNQFNFDFDANGNFTGKSALYSTRTLLFKNSDKAIKNFAISNIGNDYENVQLYKIVTDPTTEPTTDYSLKGFEIESVSGESTININETLELQFKANSQVPSFAEAPTSITYTSSNTSIATVSGNCVTGVSTGNVEITATSGTATAKIMLYVTASDGSDSVESTTVSTTIKAYAESNGWSDSTKYTSITLDLNISIAVTGNSNSGKYYTKGYEWRMYQTENPTIKISANNNKKILRIKITYKISNTGILTFNSNNISSEEIIELNDSSASLGVGNSGSATNGQVKITAIEVTYK